MNSFLTFFNKEWIELYRSKRLYVLLGIFMLFGMVSPILTRYMSEIVSSSMGSSVSIVFSTPVWSDSWKQFYNNLSQMGGISVLLLFLGSVCGEKQSKTAELTLTKNLSPAKFIIAKFTAAASMVALVFLPAVLLCWGYTYYLFGYAGKLENILIGAFLYVIFLAVELSFVMLASTIAKTTSFSAILSFAGYLLLILSGYLPKIGFMMPGTMLSSIMLVIVQGNLIHLFLHTVIACALSALFISISITVLKVQEL